MSPEGEAVTDASYDGSPVSNLWVSHGLCSLLKHGEMFPDQGMHENGSKGGEVSNLQAIGRTPGQVVEARNPLHVNDKLWILIAELDEDQQVGTSQHEAGLLLIVLEKGHDLRHGRGFSNTQTSEFS